MLTMLKQFCAGWKQAPRERDIKKEKALRDNLSEKQIDKLLQDSFPASDPAGTY